MFILVAQTTLYRERLHTYCVCVCIFAAKTAERSCPENLISGLQSVSSNKGFLQGGGTVYLSLYLSQSMSLPMLAGSLVMLKKQPQCKISFFFHFQINECCKLVLNPEQFQPMGAGGFSERGIVLHILLQTGTERQFFHNPYNSQRITSHPAFLS